MQQHMGHRHRMGNSVLVRRHHRSHDQNIGDLTDFRRLHVDDAQVDPASVAGVVIRAQGAQQHQKQHTVEYHHRQPMFRQEIQVDGGNHRIHQHTQADGHRLNSNVAEVSVELVCRCGTGNGHQAKGSHNQSKHQQEHIAFFAEIFQFFKVTVHRKCLLSVLSVGLYHFRLEK